MGGWNSTVTQGTIITPAVVKAALIQVTNLITGFNHWLIKAGQGTVVIGSPLGSTSYYDVDPDDQTYGDIDLQIVAPGTEEAKTPSQFSTHWNKLLDQYLGETKPTLVYNQGKDCGGHVVLSLDDGMYVQIDLLWSEEKLSKWMRYRMTPARGIKGAAYGNLFSTLGEIMGISIQSAGVQMKIKDGMPVPFSKSRKYDELVTLTTDIENLGTQMVTRLYQRMHTKSEQQLTMDPLLVANPGIDLNNISVERMVKMIKGIGKTFAANSMFGRYNLRDISSYEDFIITFKTHYMDKIKDAILATKFDKAETPEAIARAQDVKDKLLSHAGSIVAVF